MGYAAQATDASLPSVRSQSRQRTGLCPKSSLQAGSHSKRLFVSPSSNVRKKTTKEGFAHGMYLVLRRHVSLSSCLLDG